ncbi:hypothetical protein MUK42_06135 [Musa troglodytarum]|uniref:THIF-type NAD/FAD binding fold domain-containing protein n=1 Tax=Musa troglodytarum TaxID=320322 RepID=A0A9E7HSS5_9LILI|nr:hypothetical protein MUK42_06135 [Musa troglodytarum]
MDSKEIGGGSSGADLLREIERLRAEKEELESRIHLLEAQIKPRGTAEKDKSGSCSLSSLSCPRMNGTTLSGLSPEMIHRYSRHLLLPDFGVEGQLKLSKSSILVVGAGGLGSPVAMYLAACGVGCLGIVDSDIVELNNLHRQGGIELIRLVSLEICSPDWIHSLLCQPLVSGAALGLEGQILTQSSQSVSKRASLSLLAIEMQIENLDMQVKIRGRSPVCPICGENAAFTREKFQSFDYESFTQSPMSDRYKIIDCCICPWH